MNDSNDVTPDLVIGPSAADPRRQLVQRILHSPEFLKAPRMCALLSFLAQRVLDGMAETIDEHAIGVAVFRRDALDFDTTIDPIVRVQMGRLRARLARIDAGNPADAMRIVIPAGTYVPEFTATPVARDHVPTIRMAPLRALTTDSGAASFVSGLEEELAQRLFQRFGSPGRQDTATEYQVHVSVRVEQLHARASIRLTDVRHDRLVWLHQRDCHGGLGIARQETLALAICDDLSGFLACDAPGPGYGPARLAPT
jgi:hypothetical protein